MHNALFVQFFAVSLRRPVSRPCMSSSHILLLLFPFQDPGCSPSVGQTGLSSGQGGGTTPSAVPFTAAHRQSPPGIRNSSKPAPTRPLSRRQTLSSSARLQTISLGSFHLRIIPLQKVNQERRSRMPVVGRCGSPSRSAAACAGSPSRRSSSSPRYQPSHRRTVTSLTVGRL